MTKLELCPVTFEEACDFIIQHHRHHTAPTGWKFGVGIALGDRLVGVLVVGRPVARFLDDGWTLEVTRCCVLEDIPNGCSKLYGAAWQAARAMGFRKLITYTLSSESGSSLKAAGWRVVGQRGGGSWNRPSRPRQDSHPLGQKTLWEAVQAQ